MTSVKGDTKVVRFFSSPQLQFLSLVLSLSLSIFSALYVLIRWKNRRSRLKVEAAMASFFLPLAEKYIYNTTSPTFSAPK